jgi:hypothetical protein
MTRAELAVAANEAARRARYGGAPILTSLSSRETICRWLQWCDPNGSHLDDLAEVDGADPYDLDGAWDALAAMLDQ